MELENNVENLSVTEETEPIITPEEEPKENEADNQLLVEPAINISKYEEEYAETGQLSDESFATLEKVGISRKVAEAYIDGQKAIAMAGVAEIYAVAGGESSYNKIMEWAANNLSEQEKTAYNSVVSNGDVEAVKLALSGLQAKYSANTGFIPQRRIEGRSQTNNQGYNSMAEMVRDVQDPRYKSDEAYRKKVISKAAVSKF